MQQETSADAYFKNLANGFITGTRLRVYKALHAHPNFTANEIASLPELRSHQIDSVRPRFAELERAGLIQVTGKRECSITKMTVVTWALTNVIAIRFEKQKSKTFWILFSEKSGRMGYASPDKADLEEVFENFKNKPNHDDAQILKAQVVKPE